MKKVSQLYTIALASILAGFLSGHALANDRDLRAITVPAASCVPYIREGEPGTGAPTWVWSFAAFELSGVRPGFPYATASLRCPLPIDAIDLSGTTNDNDIDKVRILYRDSDGSGGGLTHVDVALEKTTYSPLASFRGLLSANSIPLRTEQGQLAIQKLPSPVCTTSPRVPSITLKSTFIPKHHMYQERFTPGSEVSTFLSRPPLPRTCTRGLAVVCLHLCAERPGLAD
jgi:hypothetical protein